MRLKQVNTTALRIAATNQLVNPGEYVEVDGPLGKSLCEQPKNWLAMKATKKAAGKSPAESKNNPSEED